MQRYTLVISGPIGAGKSTMLKMLKYHFRKKRLNFAIVPEYLEGMKTGKAMLNEWTQGKITLSEFNHYVMDSIDILNKRASHSRIRIMERAPIENATIFADKDENLLIQANNIHHKYNIPLVTDQHCPISILNANNEAERVFRDIVDVIDDDFSSDVPERVIYLRISAETSRNRVTDRGRKEEQAYSEDYLRSIVKKYEDLFFHTKNVN